MPDTPPPTPPTSVIIRVVVNDGTPHNIRLKPGAIEVLNNFWHAQKLEGTYAERFEKMLLDTCKTLMLRKDLAPANVTAKIAKLEAAQAELDEEIATTAAKAAGA